MANLSFPIFPDPDGSNETSLILPIYKAVSSPKKAKPAKIKDSSLDEENKDADIT